MGDIDSIYLAPRLEQTGRDVSSTMLNNFSKVKQSWMEQPEIDSGAHSFIHKSCFDFQTWLGIFDV